VNSLPKTATRQRRGCDSNPGPSAPESSTLTTRLPSHDVCRNSPHLALRAVPAMRAKVIQNKIDTVLYTYVYTKSGKHSYSAFQLCLYDVRSQ